MPKSSTSRISRIQVNNGRSFDDEGKTVGLDSSETRDALRYVTQLVQRQGVDVAWPDLSPGGSYNQWANKQRGWSWGEAETEWPSHRWPTE
jgi:hypothetical protein